MNITRGLFRIWILISALWVSFCGVILFDQIRALDAPVRLSYGKLELEFPGTIAREEMRSAIQNFLMKNPVNTSALPAVLNEQEAAEAAKKVVANYQPRSISGPVKAFLKIGLAIPFAVLALGLALAWAVAGFKPAA